MALILPKRNPLWKPPLGAQLNTAHPLAQALAAAWLLNEGGGNKIYDLSGNQNNGTLTGGVSWTPSAGGSGLKFDGSTGYVPLGLPPAINLPGALSVSVGIIPNNAVNIQVVYGDGNGQFVLRLSPTKVQLVWNSTLILTSTASLSLGTFYRIVATRTGSTGSWTSQIFINGKLDSSAGAATNPATVIGSYSLGQRGVVNTQFFNGVITDATVYPFALSAAQVQQLYTQPFAFVQPQRLYIPDAAPASTSVYFRNIPPTSKPPLGAQLNPSHPLAQRLTGAWVMNEGGGAKLYDLSGNNNHLTLNGGTTWGASPYGTAVTFNGTSGYAVAPRANTITGGRCWLTCIVQFNSVGGNLRRFIAGQQDSGGSYTCGFIDYDGEVSRGLRFWVKSNIGQSFAETSSINWASANKPYRIDGTWDGSSIKLYVNGVLNGTGGTLAGGNIVASDPFMLAHDPRTNSGSGGGVGGFSYLAGKLADVQVYQFAPTADQVQQLYTQPFCFMQQRQLILPVGASAPPVGGTYGFAGIGGIQGTGLIGVAS